MTDKSADSSIILQEMIRKRESFDDNALRGFYESLGGKVITQGGILWHSIGLRLYVPLPCKGPITIPSKDMKALWRQGALFLRYPTLDPNLRAYPSYIHLVDDKNYDMDGLSNSQRRNIRRALRKCYVEKIPIDYVLKKGLSLIEQTHIRQRRIVNRDTFIAWERYLAAASKNPLFEAYGAFVGRELAAFIERFAYRGGSYGEGLFSGTDFLKYEVMNALMFISTRDTIRRSDIDHVSYGMRAIFGDSETLNRFKESMGYKRVSVGERIEVAPWLRPAFDHGLSKLIRYVGKRYYYRLPAANGIRAMISIYAHQDTNYLDKLQVN